MGNPDDLTRRDLIARAGIFGAGMALAWPRPARAADDKDEKEEAGEEILPAEDLMREHGALERMLLIFEQQQKLLEGARDFNKWAIGQTAGLIRQFIAEYHERLEENYIFPLFKQGPMAELSQTLLRQHAAGRRLTDSIQSGLVGTLDTSARKRMAGQIGEFIRMYRPHKSREDTVLFPAVREVVPEDKYEEMGEKFEARERQLFGKDGFKGVVEHIAQIERQVGLYELNQFTPTA